MKQFLFIIVLGFACTSFSGGVISFDDYLQQIQTENLDLKVEQAKSDSMQARTSGLGIPAPSLGFLQMKDQDGSSATGFQIEQTIPFPTKMTGEYKLRKKENQFQRYTNQTQKKLIRAMAKLIYFKLWQSQKRLELLEEKKEVIGEHIKISRSAARSNSFAAIHLLKSESDYDFLENDIESAKQNIRDKQIEIGVFMNTDPVDFTVLASEPPLSQIPKSFSIEESPFYRAQAFQLESLQARESLAQSSWFPDLNLKYKEIGATNTTMANKEIMIGLTLPFLFFWEPYSVSTQAHQDKLVSEFALQKEKKIFVAGKTLLLSRIESLRKQLDALNEKLIPRAMKRMKLVHNIALRDMETLMDHRETMEALPELKLKALDVRGEYEQSIAELEKYNSELEP